MDHGLIASRSRSIQCNRVLFLSDAALFALWSGLPGQTSARASYSSAVSLEPQGMQFVGKCLQGAVDLQPSI